MTHAFLLGSGVSRDAGLPTGGEVLRNPRADLFRLVTGEAELPTAEDGLDEWLASEGHDRLSYSEILALLAPDSSVTTAAEFLADLRRRIDAFRAHPCGDTPEIVAPEVVALPRRGLHLAP